MSLASLRLSNAQILSELRQQARTQPRIYLPVAAAPRLSLWLALPFLVPLLMVFLMPQDWPAAWAQALFVLVALGCMGLLGRLLWSAFKDIRLVRPGQEPLKGWTGWQVDIASGASPSSLRQIGSARDKHQLQLNPGDEWSLVTTQFDRNDQPMLGLELHHVQRGAVALLTRFKLADDEAAMLADMNGLAQELARRLGIRHRSLASQG